MVNVFDKAYIALQTRTRNFLTSFKENQMGVSSFVATILLIVIVVALCALFWGYISDWFEQMWSKIVGNSDKIGE